MYHGHDSRRTSKSYPSNFFSFLFCPEGWWKKEEEEEEEGVAKKDLRHFLILLHRTQLDRKKKRGGFLSDIIGFLANIIKVN